MPAAIPDRYSLEVRLGRDGDIEEWLATDRSLDRPVLIRSLGPESSEARRAEFVRTVSAAAKTTHTHLARVFTVSETKGGAYAVLEWTGGATVADRVGANQPVELPDFLPNAAGLAGALDALHSHGGVHGRIDPSAVSYSGGHPAKLGAFGRESTGTAADDVRALAAAMETALTGAPPGGPPPSERVDGVSAELDTILRSGQSGELTASDLEKALRAAPTPRAPQPESGPTSRRLLIAAIALVLLAAALVAVGFVFTDGSTAVLPTPTTSAGTDTTIPATVTSTTRAGQVRITGVTSLDPFGGGGENDQLLENLIDGDTSTEWRTETYLDPLQQLKPGVGISFAVTGVPRRVELVDMTEGTSFEIYWSAGPRGDLTGRDRIASASSSPGSTTIELPPRESGEWLIWLVVLSEVGDGSQRTAISEVRFGS